MNKIGELIRRKRFENDVSQVELAKVLDCSSQFVANWERGVSKPPLNYIKTICKVAGIKISEAKDALKEDYASKLEAEIK